MSNMRSLAEEIAMVHTQKRERGIDAAVHRARVLYEVLESQEDPYSMHKAIESLPVNVLVHFLHQKTDYELCRGEGGDE